MSIAMILSIITLFLLQSSVKEMEERENEVLGAVDAGKRVMEQPNGETRGVEKKLKDTSSKWREVKSKLIEKRNKEESNFTQLVKYVSAADELEKWVLMTSSNVTAPGITTDQDTGDVNAINEQLDQIKVKD